MGIIYFAYAISKWSTIFKYYFLFLLVGAATVLVLLTDIFPLTSVYASLQLHKLNLSIVVLNLICSLGEFPPLMLSLISNQFLVLNLDGLFDALSNRIAIVLYSVIILLY